MSICQMEAYLMNGNGAGTGFQVSLPISREEFLSAAAAIGVGDSGKDNLFVAAVEPKMKELAPHLKPPFDIGELNYLAAKLEQLESKSDEQRDIFSACLQVGRHCDSAAALINLVDNLDCVDLQPAFSPEEYGAFHINLARDEYADMMNGLEQSANPEEQAFFAYVAELESHIDLAAYGKTQAENEGGAFTNYGYITESATFQEIYRGAEDIPSEFQVSPFRDAMPLLRLENTNLTDVLTKIHDLGGCENDLARNLETLHRRRSANFLLLLTDDKAVLSEAMHVYRRGTAAHDAFVENTPAKMFSIYVTDFQTEFIGDIRELDASLRRVDIHDYSIDFVAVEVETEDGESIAYTPAEWKNVTAEERDYFQSWTRKFADGDYTKVLRHIEYQTSADDFWTRTATLKEFFSKLAQDVPTKAERTPEEKPKSVLERIAAARVDRTAEPPKPEAPKHRTEPER